MEVVGSRSPCRLGEVWQGHRAQGVILGRQRVRASRKRPALVSQAGSRCPHGCQGTVAEPSVKEAPCGGRS